MYKFPEMWLHSKIMFGQCCHCELVKGHPYSDLERNSPRADVVKGMMANAESGMYLHVLAGGGQWHSCTGT
jgi:hypothetical protein